MFQATYPVRIFNRLIYVVVNVIVINRILENFITNLTNHETKVTIFCG